MTPPDAPEPFYIVYIDEAGDPGLSKVRPLDPDGASEWMTLGAVVIRARFETHAVEWVRSIREDIKQTQGSDLHFRSLSDHRKTRVAELVSELPLRAFVMLSHKPNMKGHRNPAAESVSLTPTPRDWFYNWCIRLLLERVTNACADASRHQTGEVKPIKIVFSRRGGVAYNWLQVYIEVLAHQARNGTTVLRKREIAPDVIDRRLILDAAAYQSAGCQLADVVTSAFHVAADALGPRWCTTPAERLKNVMAANLGSHQDWGVSLQPSPA